ncbi:MAG: hypothetical protein AAB393_12975, partial [Bacteroidota bacterium]
MGRVLRVLAALAILCCGPTLFAQWTTGYRTINVTFNTSNPQQLLINRRRLIWRDPYCKFGFSFS